MARSLLYKGVTFVTKQHGKPLNKWKAQYKPVNGDVWRKMCDTEIEAAKAYDLRLIHLGMPPVNILKPKTN